MIGDPAQYVGSSSGLITIAVMTLLYFFRLYTFALMAYMAFCMVGCRHMAYRVRKKGKPTRAIPVDEKTGR